MDTQARRAGDATASNYPTWDVPSGSGFYTIRVGLLNARGVTVNGAYVHAFGYTNGDGDRAYCQA